MWFLPFDRWFLGYTQRHVHTIRVHSVYSAEKTSSLGNSAVNVPACYLMTNHTASLQAQDMTQQDVGHGLETAAQRQAGLVEGQMAMQASAFS